MKQFEIQEFGFEGVKLVERERPRPAAGEVLVKLLAASLNYRDYMTVQGTYNPKMRRPLIPLSDGVGVVEEVGDQVTRFRPGDRVMAAFMQKWVDGSISREKAASALGGALDGVLSEYAIFSEQGLVSVPAFLSAAEAATLPCAGVTAWHALFEQTPAAPGDTVLLQGTGGLSIFALQLAAAAGLRTIITSSSDEKLARVRSLGAHETINYKTTPDWDEAARRLTAGEGVGHVVEVGGSDTMSKSLRAVRMGGKITVIGALSGVGASMSPVPVLMNSIRVQGIYVGSRIMLERLGRFLELNQIKPVIDQVFAWTDFKEALGHMESQRHFGKICLAF